MEQQKKLPLADGCCRRYENSSRASFDQLPIGLDVGNVGYLSVTDRNRGTQNMRLYASVNDGCADCWRRDSGACVWGIQWP